MPNAQKKGINMDNIVLKNPEKIDSILKINLSNIIEISIRGIKFK